jgi:hypothetical protein
MGPATDQTRRAGMDELERQRLEVAYERLYEDVLATLRRHDPLGVGPHLRPNEYMPETGTLLPRLKELASAAELAAIVHDEFVRWRGEQAAGPASRYGAIAEELWLARGRRLG